MKKILLSVGIIAIVAIGAIGATRAYFSDTAEMTGNTFTAGTLALKLDNNVDGGTQNWVDSFDVTSADFRAANGWTGENYFKYTEFLKISGFSNLYPGVTKTQIIDIKNAGSIDGIPSIKFDASNDNGLYQYTSISVKYNNALVAEGPLSAWNNGQARSTGVKLPADGVGNFEITLSVSPNAGNDAQGAHFDLKTTFGLNQN